MSTHDEIWSKLMRDLTAAASTGVGIRRLQDADQHDIQQAAALAILGALSRNPRLAETLQDARIRIVYVRVTVRSVIFQFIRRQEQQKRVPLELAERVRSREREPYIIAEIVDTMWAARSSNSKEREAELALDWIARGISTDEIAKREGISQRTVQRLVKQGLHKLADHARKAAERTPQDPQSGV